MALPEQFSIEVLNSIVRNPIEKADTVVNDIDKTFTVPASRVWEILSIMVDLATSATVGDRQIEVRFTTGDDVLLFKIVAAIVQAKDLTRIYMFAQGQDDDTAAFDGDKIVHKLPSSFLLPAGFKVQIIESAAVDAAADDMLVRMIVNESVAIS